MARVVVALDLGPKRVRMAALSISGKQIALVRLAEEPVAADEGPQAAVARLFAPLGSTVEAVAGLFPLQNTSVRVVKLPFVDRKRIDQVLAYELDGVFPFDVEEAVFNYIARPEPGGEAELTVAAARSELVGARLEAYRQTGHEPKTLALDAFALEAAWDGESNTPTPPVMGDEIGETEGETTALLHIGVDETLLFLCRKDGFRMARAFRLGRRDLVARGARAAAVEEGVLEAQLAGERDSTRIESVFRPLFREVEATLRSTEKTAKVRPARLVLSGEAARWPGVVDAAGLTLRIPSEELRWNDALVAGNEGALGDYAPLVGAAIQASRGGGIDLRCGAFAYTRAIEVVKGKLMVTAAFAAALILLVAAGQGFTYFTKSREAARLKAEMEAVFTEVMPGEPLVDPLQQLEAKVKSLRSRGDGGGGEPIVEILKGLSQVVGPGTVFKINEFHRDAGGFRVKGETDSYEKADAIKAAVVALPGMKGITVCDSKTAPGGGIVFELCVEEPGG